jgi:exopolyphosphatase/guanosine-5'-triphosphate,3'-diphosphate pyrophosphatase
MNIAVLDLGTNTFNLLINQLEGNSYRLLYKDKIAVKLGEGGINKGEIMPAPFERGLEAIEDHLETCKQFDVSRIVAFGTSALRSAKNGHAFKSAVYEQLNLSIDIIDGDREAELIYKGVKQAFPLSEQPHLIMDVGGGSTEFIIGNSYQIFWKKSYPIGAARLLDKFQHQEPIRKGEITAIQSYLANQFTEVEEQVKKHEVTEMIGSSGSFETLADMISYEQTGTSIFEQPFTFKTIDLEALKKILPKILMRNVADRLMMPGMLPLRVEMMVVVSIFIELILNKLKITSLYLSDYAMKEGIMSEIIEQNKINEHDINNRR